MVARVVWDHQAGSSSLPSRTTSERNPLHSVSRRSLLGAALKLRSAPLLLLSNSNPLRWASSWFLVRDDSLHLFLSTQNRSEISITAPFPPRGENCAMMGISSPSAPSPAKRVGAAWGRGTAFLQVGFARWLWNFLYCRTARLLGWRF